MRLARAVGGSSIDYWMELPINELLLSMFELADQLKQEQEAIERAQKK